MQKDLWKTRMRALLQDKCRHKPIKFWSCCRLHVEVNLPVRKSKFAAHEVLNTSAMLPHCSTPVVNLL